MAKARVVPPPMFSDVEVLFTCQYAENGIVLNEETGEAVCTNNRHWEAKGVYMSPERIEVRNGQGMCPECGNMGTAKIRDELVGATVFVYEGEGPT